MKKLLLTSILLSVCLFTGCTKSYNTAEEYAADMQTVRSSLGNYTIEAQQSDGIKTYDMKSYFKDNKWKTENLSNPNDVTGLLYNGEEVLSFSKANRIAMSIPFKKIFEGKNDEDSKMALDIMTKLTNPAGVLMYWDKLQSDKDNKTVWVVDNKLTTKNNFPCRMLTSENIGEMCISDKYGIAVYSKLNIETPKGSGKYRAVETNVKTISNEPIDSSKLNLPEGVKKISMEEIFKNIASKLNEKK